MFTYAASLALQTNYKSFINSVSYFPGRDLTCQDTEELSVPPHARCSIFSTSLGKTGLEEQRMCSPRTEQEPEKPRL